MRTSAGTFWKAGLTMEMSSGRSSSLAISILMLEAMLSEVSFSCLLCVHSRDFYRRIPLDKASTHVESPSAKRAPYSQPCAAAILP
jgi:hypothetical protein